MKTESQILEMQQAVRGVYLDMVNKCSIEKDSLGMVLATFDWVIEDEGVKTLESRVKVMESIGKVMAKIKT